MSTSSNVPAPILRAIALMAGYSHPWVLCGGWAVDLWLGRQTRDHGDLDITIFERDLPAAFRQFTGWTLNADDATNGANREQWDGRALVLPAHIHARETDGLELELIVNPGGPGEWVLTAKPPITLPFEHAVRAYSPGLLVAAPEVLMFYKSRLCNGCPGCSAPRKLRPHDEADFHALLPGLGPVERAWLRGALAAVEPGHAWLKLL